MGLRFKILNLLERSHEFRTVELKDTLPRSTTPEGEKNCDNAMAVIGDW